MQTGLLEAYGAVTEELVGPEKPEAITDIPRATRSAYQQTDIPDFLYDATSTGHIKPLIRRHAKKVAALHINGINAGFISSLGIDFVTALYEAIAESESGFGLVCTSRTDNSKVLGFVVFTTELGKLYRSVLSKKGWVFALLLARKMFSFGRVKKVCETLLYPSKTKKIELPSSELLSIVVAPEARRLGLGSELIGRGLENCRLRGIKKVKVMVAANNKAANSLYRTCGFAQVRQIESHGVPSNLYVASTSAIGRAHYSPAPNLLTSTLQKPTVAEPNLAA